MACTNPRPGWLVVSRTGEQIFTTRQPSGREHYSEPMTVACRKCISCQLSKSSEWAVRSMNEAYLYSANTFITLTYRNSSLPLVPGTSVPTLHHPHWQQFMKDLRRNVTGVDEVPHWKAGQFNAKTGRPYPDTHTPIRFYMAGEYGSKRGRPHFHALLFNYQFPDLRFHRKTKQGFNVYRSAILEDLWPHGFSEVGEVTFKSAAYVARYIMEKKYGDDAFAKYCAAIDSKTGELLFRSPEYNQPSTSPGLGRGWIERFSTQVLTHDAVFLDGRSFRPPRYYDVFHAAVAPQEILHCKALRSIEAQKLLDDNTPERLQDKAEIARRSAQRLVRTLD